MIEIAPGRRYKEPNEKVTLGCSHTGKTWNFLSDIAREHEVSLSEVIRIAIDKFVDEYKAQKADEDLSNQI